jgi:hypothetical protein
MDWHVASPRAMAMTKSIAVSKDLVSRNPSLSLHHHDHIVKQHASIQGLAPPHQHGRINCTLTQWICTTSPSTPSSHPHERRSKAAPYSAPYHKQRSKFHKPKVSSAKPLRERAMTYLVPPTRIRAQASNYTPICISGPRLVLSRKYEADEQGANAGCH